MCNYEQTALNKARLFAPIEYYFATKTFPQLRILKPYENSAYVNRKFLNVKYCKRIVVSTKLRVKHCTYANDAMYFFEDCILYGRQSLPSCDCFGGEVASVKSYFSI